MQAIPAMTTATHSNDLPELLFYAPNEVRMQPFLSKLQGLARVSWENSRLRAPAQLTQRSGVRLVLLDYAPESAAHSSDLARQLTALMPDTPLVAIGSTASEHAASVLAAWRAGVRDFIDINAAPEEIHAVLRRALTQGQPARAALTSVTSPRGRLILLLGLRAGIGTSTLATHLGVLAQPTAPEPDGETSIDLPNQVLLLDLGRPAGDAMLYLGVASDFHYDDALRNATRIDPTLTRTALAHHASRLALLSQAQDTLESPIDAPETSLLIDRLRGIYNLLLCDLGGLNHRQIPAPLLQAADEIWLVVDQSIGSMISLDAALHDLAPGNQRDPRLGLVVNRYDEACGITPQQIAERFTLPLLATLPERSRALRATANQGRLLHETAPRDPYLRALAPLIARLRLTTTNPVATQRWKSFLLGLGGSRWKTR